MRKKIEKNFWDMEIIGNRRKSHFFTSQFLPKIFFFANYGSVFEYPTFPFSWPLCPNWVLFQHRKSIKSWPSLEYCCHNFFLFWNFCARISNQSLLWDEEIGKEERFFVSYCNLHETLDSLLCCSLDYNGKLTISVTSDKTLSLSEFGDEQA